MDKESAILFSGIVALAFSIAFGLYFLGKHSPTGCDNNTRYTGVCRYKYTDAGYKSVTRKHVVFYCDSLRINIDVNTTNNTYCNVSVGDTVSFDLSYCDLND